MAGDDLIATCWTTAGDAAPNRADWRSPLSLRDPRLRSVIIEFNYSSAASSRRDGPLRAAGFVAVEEGIEYERANVRWRNVIYGR